MLKSTEQLYHICGDAPDPAGTGRRGVSSTIGLHRSAIGHPQIVYEHAGHKRVITADIYRIDGQLLVHVLCPLCSVPGRPHALSIKQANKRIEYDERSDVISIERFKCTWETDPEVRRDFGTAVCTWQVVVENNIAKDA